MAYFVNFFSFIRIILFHKIKCMIKYISRLPPKSRKQVLFIQDSESS